ncbi:MAG: amino acid ABC transporter permease [Lachnospiraceae bacterium]
MNFSMESFKESLLSGINYIPHTFALVIVPILFGLIAGTLIALVRISKVPFFFRLLQIIVTIYQGVPVVAALLIYNMLFLTQFENIVSFLHLNISISSISSFWIGIFALSLNVTCNISETVRGAFMSVDKGQWEAGYCVGLTKTQTTVRIILPQMITAAIPNLVSIVIGLIKNSSVVVAIGITEIMVGATIPANTNYCFFEAYLAAALIYWLINIIIEFLAKKIENHSKRYRSATA